MNVVIKRIFTKVGNSHNVIVVRSISTETLSRWWCKITNQKPKRRTFKAADIYGPEHYEVHETDEKIGFSAYCLLVR